MKPASSNAENTGGTRNRTPHIWEIHAQLKREGRVSAPTVLRYALRHLPPLVLVTLGFYWLAQFALWQPLRKALFSYREELAFSYGDFILFFLLTIVLVGMLLVTLWRMYRHECRLLELCNFGARAESYAFDADRTHYRFADAAGVTHNKRFVEDYINLYPLGKRLLEDSREALPNFQLFAVEGARKCAAEIATQQKPAQVYYLPADPATCQMVVQGRMGEYFWRV